MESFILIKNSALAAAGVSKDVPMERRNTILWQKRLESAIFVVIFWLKINHQFA
jgi:hypothetical protein